MKQFLEALGYKQESRGFDLSWGLGKFILTNCSGLTMALESTQSLTELSPRDVRCG